MDRLRPGSAAERLRNKKAAWWSRDCCKARRSGDHRKRVYRLFCSQEEEKNPPGGRWSELRIHEAPA